MLLKRLYLMIVDVKIRSFKIKNLGLVEKDTKIYSNVIRKNVSTANIALKINCAYIFSFNSCKSSRLSIIRVEITFRIISNSR